MLSILSQIKKQVSKLVELDQKTIKTYLARYRSGNRQTATVDKIKELVMDKIYGLEHGHDDDIVALEVKDTAKSLFDHERLAYVIRSRADEKKIRAILDSIRV
jgi:hypothetical protein